MREDSFSVCASQIDKRSKNLQSTFNVHTMSTKQTQRPTMQGVLEVIGDYTERGWKQRAYGGSQKPVLQVQ
jgi:hypothetical protein